jgi:hydrogenase expression/formation protein HypD
MKYVDEFRDRVVAAALAERIKKTVRRPWTIMEVCGGQTHAIVRFGLDSLLSQDLMLVQGRARIRSLKW